MNEIKQHITEYEHIRHCN